MKRASTIGVVMGYVRAPPNAGSLWLVTEFGQGLAPVTVPIDAVGPIHGIGIQAGLNLQTRNTALAPNERTLYFGPNLQFVFGSGFLNIGLHLWKEWNRNGILGKNEDCHTNFNIMPVWSFPFRVGRAQFVFEGYAD